jgi:uracil-DNA glycosylase family 4
VSEVPRLLADAARALADHLRFQQALGTRDLPLKGEYLAGAAARLQRLEAAIQGCTRCKLAAGRTTIVFGSGDPAARLVLIGEGPGEEEDRQGKPFVGRAGQKLTEMLAAVGITRAEVYICNIVKCRPPGNRNPEPDEIAACAPFLAGQLAAIRPRVICALGTFAAQTLLRTRESIGRLRGRVHAYGDAIVIPTFHPAFIIRNPGLEYRKQAFEDMKLIRREYDRARETEPPRA